MLPYTPLHHLLLADLGVPLVMTSGNVSDEPIAFEDGDAQARLAGHRRRVPAPRPADPHAHRRLGGPRRRRAPADCCAARAATCPSSLPLPGRAAAADPRLRRRAQEHVLPRHGTRARGSPTTSATCATRRRCAAFADGVAHFERAVRRRARGDRPRPAPGVPLDQVRARARGRAPRRRPAPPRAPRRRAWPSTARRARRSARSTTAPATGPTASCGAASCSSGDLAGFERAGHLRPVRMPGGEQAIRQPWRMACAWLQEALGEEPEPLPGVERGALARRGVARARRAGGAADHEHRAAVRRGRRAVRRAAGGHLRGAGGDRARGRRRAGRPRPLRAAARRPRARPAPARARGRGRPARRASRRGSSPRASTTPSPRRPPRPASRRPPRAGSSTAVLSGGVFANRRLLEGTAGRLRAAGLRVLVPERLPPGDGGDLLRSGVGGGRAVRAEPDDREVGEPGAVAELRLDQRRAPRRAAPPRAR